MKEKNGLIVNILILKKKNIIILKKKYESI
jgi:hypothetical protein